MFDLDSKPDHFIKEDSESVDNLTTDGRPTINFNRPHNTAEETVEDIVADKPRRRKSGRGRQILWWTAVILVLVLVGAFWMRYINPYSVDNTERGYITDIEHRGITFKTWEGHMIVEQALTDSTRMYQRDFDFSVDNDSLAREIRKYKGTGRAIKVTYNRYLGSLPWRGSHCIVVTGIEPDTRRVAKSESISNPTVATDDAVIPETSADKSSAI